MMRYSTGWKRRSKLGWNRLRDAAYLAGGSRKSLDRIVEYIAEDDPAAALSVLSTIREAPQVLLEHPRIGRPGRVEGTRELVVSGLPYILPYEIRDQDIRILAIVHTSRSGPIPLTI